jgi:hypothetical protein
MLVKIRKEGRKREDRRVRARSHTFARDESAGNRRRASVGAGRKEGCRAVAAAAACGEKIEVIIPLEQWPHDLAYASRSMSHGH